MKKYLLLSVICILAASCNGHLNTDTHVCKHTKPIPVSPNSTNGDEYLYTITYTDLDYYTVGDYMEERYGRKRSTSVSLRECGAGPSVPFDLLLVDGIISYETEQVGVGIDKVKHGGCGFAV